MYYLCAKYRLNGAFFKTNTMHLKIIFLTLMGLFCQFSTQIFAQNTALWDQPVNALYPAKDFSPEAILERGYRDSKILLRGVLPAFGADKNQKIAILVNNSYLTMVQGNGIFPQVAGEDLFVKKVQFADIERLELRYNPVYMPNEGVRENFLGTVHFVVRVPPDFKKAQQPTLDPALAATLYDIAHPSREKLTLIRTDLATTRVRTGIYAGIQTSSSGLFLGAPLEVPIDEHFSIHGTAQVNLKRRFQEFLIDTTLTAYNIYNFLALEIGVAPKYYINTHYPRVYLWGGPYVELGRGAWRGRILNQLVPDNVIREKIAYGGNFGAGIAFFRGWTIDLSGSIVAPGQNNLLPLQRSRGLTITIGYTFGEP